MIIVCFFYLSRCFYKVFVGDVCCDDFFVRFEIFIFLNVELKILYVLFVGYFDQN